MEQLQKDLLLWAKLDNQLKELNKDAASIRKKKEILQLKICPQIKKEQLEDNIFSMPSLGTNVVLKEQKTSENLTYKYLEEKLMNYFNSIETTQSILTYLKDNRKQEINLILKTSEIKDE